MDISKPRVFLQSLLFSYILSGILLIAVSFALFKFRLKESQVEMAVHLVYILSCGLAGFLAGKGLKRRRFFCGLAAGLLYFAVLLAVSMILNRGVFSGMPRLLSTLAFCAGSGIIGGVLS